MLPDERVVNVSERSLVGGAGRNMPVRRNTPVWIVYREAGMYPIQHQCLHNMITFLRRALQLHDREYVKISMLDCMADAAASATTINWFSVLSDLLRKMFLLEDIDSATIDVEFGAG
jgi:hypothetical protein